MLFLSIPAKGLSVPEGYYFFNNDLGTDGWCMNQKKLAPTDFSATKRATVPASNINPAFRPILSIIFIEFTSPF